MEHPGQTCDHTKPGEMRTDSKMNESMEKVDEPPPHEGGEVNSRDARDESRDQRQPYDP
jgi:hypothetical protein